eukprot:351209-Chlamydomonas_euryale.AAC.5
MNSHDADEASRCLRALSVPFFHHELVKQSLHLAMGAPPGARAAALSLLARFSRTGEISQSQMAKGIRRVTDNLADLCLDNPSAKEQYDSVMQVGGKGAVRWRHAGVWGRPKEQYRGLMQVRLCVWGGQYAF